MSRNERNWSGKTTELGVGGAKLFCWRVRCCSGQGVRHTETVRHRATSTIIAFYSETGTSEDNLVHRPTSSIVWQRSGA